MLFAAKDASVSNLREVELYDFLSRIAGGFRAGEANQAGEGGPIGIDSSLSLEMLLDEAARKMRSIKQRGRRVSLGNPPTIHAKRARWLAGQLRSKAHVVQTQAAVNRCDLATFAYDDVLRARAALDENLHAIGQHGRKYAEALKSVDLRRMEIAARKALETHCGRPK